MAEKDPVFVDPLIWAKDWLSASEYEVLTAFMERPLDLSIRINTLKADPDAAIKKWRTQYGWETEAIQFCPAGFRVRPQVEAPSATPEHRLGYFYIQEAASMLPPELFDFSGIQDPLVLDMAASPGGKTTHLSALTGDRGLLIANDGSRSRIPALQVVLGNWGAINQGVTCLPGEAFGSLYPDTFDAVLLDAPCSMQGLRTAESHTSRTITLSEIESLAERQVRLLESALYAAKPGGQVVYSTCTLAPQEDELVLATLLKRHPNCFRIEDAHLSAPAQGMTKFNGEKIPDTVKHALRLWPHTLDTAGFFTARLTKTDMLKEAPGSYWRLPPTAGIPTRLPAREQKTLEGILEARYGFDLNNLLEEQSLEIGILKGQYTLIPQRIKSQFNDLPILSTGMALGKPMKDELQISHAFTSRFGDSFSKGVLIIEEEYLPVWLRGEDLRKYPFEPNTAVGEIYAIQDTFGRNLGRGKLLKERLRNMLPTRLF